MSLFTRGKLPGWLFIGAMVGATFCGRNITLASEDGDGGAVTSFKRGDANIDGKINIADIIFIIMNRLQAQVSQCMDAADADDGGTVNIADAVYVAQYYFRDGPPPKAPFPACGSDPTGTDALNCEVYAACP